MKEILFDLLLIQINLWLLATMPFVLAWIINKLLEEQPSGDKK